MLFSIAVATKCFDFKFWRSPRTQLLPTLQSMSVYNSPKSVHTVTQFIGLYNSTWKWSSCNMRMFFRCLSRRPRFRTRWTSCRSWWSTEPSSIWKWLEGHRRWRSRWQGQHPDPCQTLRSSTRMGDLNRIGGCRIFSKLDGDNRLVPFHFTSFVGQSWQPSMHETVLEIFPANHVPHTGEPMSHYHVKAETQASVTIFAQKD